MDPKNLSQEDIKYYLVLQDIKYYLVLRNISDSQMTLWKIVEECQKQFYWPIKIDEIVYWKGIAYNFVGIVIVSDFYLSNIIWSHLIESG